MSIFDDKPEPINFPFPTGGGKVFWEDLDHRDGYRLQQHKLDKSHCRILDSDDWRVAWGTEGQMRAKLRELTAPRGGVKLRFGDIIGVHRLGGVYDHYGVYESDDRVYEYADKEHDFGEPDIHITTLREFVRDSGNCFVLEFPSAHTAPGKVNVPWNPSSIMPMPHYPDIVKALLASKDYHLYSPEETVRRARSKLGEKKYNLIFNNCEHFAIWCKTGIHESHQVDALLKSDINITTTASFF